MDKFLQCNTLQDVKKVLSFFVFERFILYPSREKRERERNKK